MNRLFLLFIIPLIIFSCSKKEDELVLENQETNVFGQWNFSNTISKSANYSSEEICEIRTIIFKEDGTFILYTDNYALFGDYSISDLVISLSINSELIGEISDFELSDTDTVLSGAFDFPNLCVEVSDGYIDQDYSESLTYIPDDYFEKYSVDNGYDDIMDDYIITSNIADVTSLGVGAEDLGFEDDQGNILYGDDRFKNRITNLSGIEAFTSLKILNITGNKLDSINLSQNSKLTHFYGNFNEFIRVDTRKNPELTDFSLDNSEGTILDFTQNPKLEMLDIAGVGFNTIDLSNNPNLTFLDLNSNNLTSIDLSHQTNVLTLRLSYNPMTTIDLSSLAKLKDLGFAAGHLTSIDLSYCPELTSLDVGSDSLTTIDVSNNLNLESLEVSGVNLETLDISMLTNLTALKMYAPNMSCMHVNQSQYDLLSSGSWEIPANIAYSLQPCD